MQLNKSKRARSAIVLKTSFSLRPFSPIKNLSTLKNPIV